MPGPCGACACDAAASEIGRFSIFRTENKGRPTSGCTYVLGWGAETRRICVGDLNSGRRSLPRRARGRSRPAGKALRVEQLRIDSRNDHGARGHEHRADGRRQEKSKPAVTPAASGIAMAL